MQASEKSKPGNVRGITNAQSHPIKVLISVNRGPGVDRMVAAAASDAGSRVILVVKLAHDGVVFARETAMMKHFGKSCGRTFNSPSDFT